ncbi:MAG TPA: ROK family protein [Kofleriaceae bacterium]|nr:ROK family protein [Kofleriaceae bacterium]
MLATQASTPAAASVASGSATIVLPRTLAIDIGGTGLKAMLLGADGTSLGERARVETPRPATPENILPALFGLIQQAGEFERVSVGFPGVVVEGITRTAPNLDPSWGGFDLAKALAEHTGRTVRVLNDAGVQGYGVIEGRGVEMVLTFGTGMGCALFVDGIYVPNLELAHHPFGGRKGASRGSYEDYVDDHARRKIGKKKWNKRVRRVVLQVLPIWNPRVLYLGGGNARHIKGDLPENVRIVSNLAGLTGGIALWRDRRD